MRKITWIAIAVLAGSVLLCMAGGVILSEGALRVPRHASIAPAGEPVVTREIRARDGVRLRAWLVFPPHRNGNCVMVLHGISDSRQSSLGFAPLFTGQGYTVLLPDSRAHGESGGDIVTYGVLEADDVSRWIDLLTGPEGCHEIFGLGESLGGGILLESLATEKRFRAIVAEAPFSSLENIGEDRVAQLLRLPNGLGRAIAYPLVRCAFLYCRIRYHIDSDAASPEKAAAHATTPILLIAGLSDGKTPPRHSRVIASRNPGIALWLVPKAVHTGAWAAAPEEFPRRVLSWFASHQ